MITIEELKVEPGAEINFSTEDGTTIESFTPGDWSGNQEDFTVFDSDDGETQATIYVPSGCAASYSMWKNIKNLGEPIDISDGTSICFGNCEGFIFSSGEIVGTAELSTVDINAVVAQAQADNNSPPTNGVYSLILNNTVKVNGVVYNGKASATTTRNMPCITKTTQDVFKEDKISEYNINEEWKNRRQTSRTDGQLINKKFNSKGTRSKREGNSKDFLV